MSTKRMLVRTSLSELDTLASALMRASGTATMPTFGSIVQNGKFAASALAFDSELNKVLLPTFGRPTIPQEKPIARLP